MLRLEFTQKLPADTPAGLKVFKLEKARVDQRRLSNILSYLGLASDPGGPRWRSEGGWTTAESDDTRLSINQRSGAIRFWNRLKPPGHPEPSFSIGEARLVFIARNFLTKTGLVDLPADQLKPLKITYLRVQTMSVKGKSSEPKILDAGVIFGREIDGVPVSGPGGFAMINIASDESVVGGTVVWRRLGKSLGTVKVLKPDYALNELGRNFRLQGIDRLVHVVKSEFCYFERGENDAQFYLEPAYAFVYEYETKQNRFPYKSAMVVPAILGSRQNWNPPKRFS